MKLRAVLIVAVVALVSSTANADNSSVAEYLRDAYTAYDAGDLKFANSALHELGGLHVANEDYALWLRGQIALLVGDAKEAKLAFTSVSKRHGSIFARGVPWKLADCQWLAGEHAAAAKAYEHLLTTPRAEELADLGVVHFRIAQAAAEKGSSSAAVAAYRAFLLAYPSHPLANLATQRAQTLGGAAAIAFSPSDHLARAEHLTAAHLWDDAIAELALIPDDVAQSIRDRRDFQTGITLFKMRRRYGEAGALLLAVYPRLGGEAAEAMFHGARALSRADHDDDAISWYHRVVTEYPSSPYAQEAQFLTGWLEFNRGNYRAAIAPLEETLRRFGHSKSATDALWFLGMSHYFLGEWTQAEARFVELGSKGKSLEGGKGQYWLARVHERSGHADVALPEYRSIVAHWPFSWYALLARARLAAAGVTIGPFGDGDPHAHGPAINATMDPSVEHDPLIVRADELIAAGLGTEAGDELERDEKGFLKRHDHAAAFAVLFDRYRRAGNFNRPWMLGIVYSGSALDGPAQGASKTWWQNAYPRAYQTLIEKYQALGGNPPNYLYSIMRKESGFDPHDISYADAQGLLQMIPATTIRVASVMGLPYDASRLYEPIFNVQVGSWYIGHLLSKFGTQIPIGAGSFNCGPKPVMRWLEQNGDRSIDEFVELVPYEQTREYMKKVTENFARYTYLYEGTIYEQPLTVDKHYRVDEIVY